MGSLIKQDKNEMQTNDFKNYFGKQC